MEVWVISDDEPLAVGDLGEAGAKRKTEGWGVAGNGHAHVLVKGAGTDMLL